MTKKLAALVLAAGQGKRMHSDVPKVLHTCAGIPLVAHAVRVALARACDPVVVVVGPDSEGVREALGAMFPEAPLVFAVQEVPRGTGDAVRAGLAQLGDFHGRLAILCGDVPLLRAETLAELQTAAEQAPAVVLSAEVANPAGYGRIVREQGRVLRIVEEKDASDSVRAIHEVNAGTYVFDVALLREGVAGLDTANAQGELYLTDVVEHAAATAAAHAVKVTDPAEVRGVNTRAELADAEKLLRKRLVSAHQRNGVTFRDPDTVVLDADVQIGRDSVIGPGVQLYGATEVGAHVHIEGPAVLRQTRVGASASVKAFSHLEHADVGDGCTVGPFARLREDTVLESAAKVGNFVELKKTRLATGAKASHLAYLGDAELGPETNVGAGTITCNYDGGPVKHATKTGEAAFIGSNSTLVAPVEIGDGAYVAAGSTITQDVPKDALAFGRSRQTNREGYAARLRARIKSGSS